MINKIINLGISKTEALELIKTSKSINKDLQLLRRGYPVQYLIGYVNFYGNKILVNKNVLIPRFETEILVEKTINYINKLKIKNPIILDLCTGSGCIAITLKKKFQNATIYASDISSKAINVAKENAKLNKVTINFIKSNLFKKIKIKKFDVIISNPPYVSYKEKTDKVLKYEPKKALFSVKNGVFYIAKIIKNSVKYNPCLVAIETNSYSDLKKLIPDNTKYSIEKDLNNRQRYLFLMNK